jgi:hypothetical protein
VEDGVIDKKTDSQGCKRCGFYADAMREVSEAKFALAAEVRAARALRKQLVGAKIRYDHPLLEAIDAYDRARAESCP